nr:choice-of-anchor I family protein [uncultured Desulfobulbus sp.]
MKKCFAVLAVTCACVIPVAAQATAIDMTWSHQWTASNDAKDGSASQTAEILARDESNNRIWVVGTEGIDILDATNGIRVATIDLSSYGEANSIAIQNGRVAVALSAADKTDPGKVIFYDLGCNWLSEVEVGANPDMVVFTQDGRLLVANEGEPDATDPVGSISIVATDYSVTTAGFEAFVGMEDALRNGGVRIFAGKSTAEDLEPEYIAVSPDGATAYVTLQENNSLAVVDLVSNTVTEILPLGTKAHSVADNGMDASNKDGIDGNIQTWPVQGMYMPDGIAAYQVNGNNYYVTANEGDSRNEAASVEDLRLDATTFPDASSLQKKENLGKLEVSTIDGDTDGDGDYDQLFSYGARSFSIWDADGQLVWDSGDFIETYLRDNYPALLDDGRSDNKGPEPEGVALLEAYGETLAFIGLERSNAIMAFDITDPTNPIFLSLFSTEGDEAPEGFLAYAYGGDYWLAVANEGSATTTLYQLHIRPVPEPTTALLFSCGIFGLALAGRRRR